MTVLALMQNLIDATRYQLGLQRASLLRLKSSRMTSPPPILVREMTPARPANDRASAR